MKSYSQNGEDLIVRMLFKGYVGTLLSIGENDGVTYSNSKLLIDKGWSAYLIEPSSTFNELQAWYSDNCNVRCFNFGIGLKDEVVPFFESGAHLPGGNDKALVSSVDFEETERWRNSGVEFVEKNIQLVSWATFMDFVDTRTQFDFISIDVEGLEFDILQQIDLDAVGCKVICLEHNGDMLLKGKFMDYCKGFKLIDANRENIVLSKI